MNTGEMKLKSANSAHLPDIYDNPGYWCGNIGYRPPGYFDFTINSIKEMAILLHRPTSVLDIGCAYGVTVWRLNKIGLPAKGLDISQLALSRAPDKQYLTQGVVWDMPFKDKEFDFAFSSGMLEHVPEDLLSQTVNEIKRVANRGLLGIAVTDDETTHQEDDKTHEKIKSIKEWKELFPPEFEIISDSEVSWRIYSLLFLWSMINP